MKNDSESIKKYNLSDLLVNTRKFKDYLDLCKKKNLLSEKKSLMEELIKNLQEKKISQNALALPEYLNNCAFAIIFSDFEAELFFEIPHFNPDLQKNIFFQTINYCCDRQRDLESYISTKFQFWILKMKNSNFAKITEGREVVSDVEVQESIESLKKCANQDIFNKSEDNVQILYLKAVYELGVYYYFNNDFEEANKYFKFIDKNLKNFQDKQKLFYFDEKSISNLLKYINKNNKIEEGMPPNPEKNIFELEDVSDIINEDYQKYKNEIENVKEETIMKNTNELDESKKEKLGGILKYLKISEYLFHLTFENFNNYDRLKNYLSILKEIPNKKLNNYKEENIYVKYIKKEISYHSILFQIIESLINKSTELPESFIINLSNIIQQNNFTDDISLSGMIHSSLINFESSYKIIYKYFNDFVEFLSEIKSENNNKEIINQIVFIARIMSVIYIILDSKSKINSLGEKEIIINIEKELHVNIINIFLFWLENDKEKNELKYDKNLNIIYILIETMKKVEYLKIYKIIVLAVLEYLINNKNIKNKNNSKDNNKSILINNINDYIKQLKPKIFKLSTLSEEELKYNKKEINSENLYFSIKVNFIETKEKEKDNNILKQIELNYDFYINKLFELIELIEDQIKQYEYESHTQIPVEQNSNCQNFSMSIYPNILIKKDFLYSFYKMIETTNIDKKKIGNILLIKKGIDYINNDLAIVKFNYMKNDLLNNSNYDINKIYELFKKNINQEILSKIILTLIKNNLILESIVLVQYSKSFNQNLEYALIRAFYDSEKEINNECCKYIWKINYFEYLANIFNKNNDKENLEQVKMIIKKIGNHRFFKDHPLRKHFKIINFLNFLEYINSILFKI
jgi:hypothetical protein